jgi:hypothetical protein
MDGRGIKGFKGGMRWKMLEILRVKPGIKFLTPDTLERVPYKKSKLVAKLYEK